MEEQNINQRLSSLTIALGSKTHTPLVRDDRNKCPLSWMLSDENANIIMRVMASFGMLPMRQSCASGEPSGTVALAMRWPRPPQTRALLSMGISGRRPEWKVVVCMLVPIAATLTIANIKATLFDTLHASQVKSRWNNVCDTMSNHDLDSS